MLESGYKQSGHAIREPIRHRFLCFQDKITITIAIRESTNLLCTKRGHGAGEWRKRCTVPLQSFLFQEGKNKKVFGFIRMNWLLSSRDIYVM